MCNIYYRFEVQLVNQYAVYNNGVYKSVDSYCSIPCSSTHTAPTTLTSLHNLIVVYFLQYVVCMYMIHRQQPITIVTY